jgi:prophage maintenance system killer protein
MRNGLLPLLLLIVKSRADLHIQMKYLSVEQVLFIHNRVLREAGGTEGVRDLSLLLPAVHRPQASFEGKDPYPDLLDKSAALLECLARSHALVDGNKRAALTGFVFIPPQPEAS